MKVIYNLRLGSEELHALQQEVEDYLDNLREKTKDNRAYFLASVLVKMKNAERERALVEK